MAEPSDEYVSRIATEAAREALAGHKSLDKQQLSNMALAAAKEAVRETHAELFSLLGINIANFDDVKRFRANLEFLESLHSGTAKMGARAMFAFMTMMVGAIGLAVWLGIKAALAK